MSDKLPPYKLAFGQERLEELMKLSGVSEEQAISVLDNIRKWSGFYSWYQAEEFICEKISEKKEK